MFVMKEEFLLQEGQFYTSRADFEMVFAIRKD